MSDTTVTCPKCGAGTRSPFSPAQLPGATRRALFALITTLASTASATNAQDRAALAAQAQAVADSARAAVLAGGVDNYDFARRLHLRAATLFHGIADYGAEAESLEQAAAFLSPPFGSDVGAALALQRRALDAWIAAADTQGEVHALFALAGYFNELGQTDSIRAYIDRALRRAEALADSSLIAEAWANRAAWLQDAYPDSAIVYYREALGWYRPTRDDESISTAIYLLSVAADSMRARHERDRLPSADSVIRYLRMTVDLLERILDQPGGTHFTWHERRLELASFFEQHGQRDSALVNWKWLIAHGSDEDIGRDVVLAALDNVARSYREAGPQDSALHYLKALAHQQRAHEDRGEGGTLRTIAGIYRSLGQPDSAWHYFTLESRARKAALDFDGQERATRDAESVGFEPPPEDSAVARARVALESIPILFLDIDEYLLQRASALGALARAYHRESARPDLFRASEYYDSASTVILNLLAEEPADSVRIRLSERVADLHAEWALAWLARAPEDGLRRSQQYALAALERGRGMALRLMRGFSTMSRDLWGEFDAGLETEALYWGLSETRNAAVLSYLVSSDTIVIWMGEAAVARVPIPRDTLVDWVRTMRLGIEETSTGPALREIDPASRRGFGPQGTAAADFESVRARLYETLLPDTVRRLLPDSGDVVVAPGGYLNELPFAALARDSSSEPFGIRYAIRYTPTLQILGDSLAEAGQALPRMPDKFYFEGDLLEGVPLERKAAMDDSARVERRAWLRRSLVVGDPRMPDVTTASGQRFALTPLPGAKAEGESVAALLGTLFITDAVATETMVRERMADATIVHLATHGFAYSDPVDTGNTFIALATDGRHDGVLTVDEVLRTPEFSVTADLVVLSACQTGLGAPTAAEGTLGLQRAFLARGARTLIVSLWNVSDAATRLLMERFYAHWLDEEKAPDKAEALRQAQQDVRATEGYGHPRYWAAFQLVGAR